MEKASLKYRLKQQWFFLRNQKIFILGLCLLVLLSVLLWQFDRFRDITQLNRETESLGRNFTYTLENQYDALYTALERIIARGSPSARTDPSEWDRDAGFFLESLTGVSIIAWVDNGYVLRRFVSDSDIELRKDEAVPELFSREPVSGFHVWLPSYNGNALEGFLLGEIDVAAMVKSLMSEETRIKATVTKGGRILYSNSEPSTAENRHVFTAELKNSGRLSIEIEAAQARLRSIRRQSLKILVFGLFLTCITSATFLLAGINRRKARISENRFQKIFKASQDAVFVIDFNGRYQDANPAALKMTGYDREELLNMRTADLQTEDYPFDPTEQKLFWQSGGELQIRIRHRDGHTIPIEMTVSPIKEQNSEPVYVMGIARNITRRLAYEERLKEALDEREVLIRELYHRTKNNMQVIISLLQLNSFRSNSNEVKRLVEETSRKIISMSLVHKMLYAGNDLSHIDLKEYILELFDTLEKMHEQEFTVDTVLDSISVSIDTAVPIGMILAEWYTNTQKHAYSQTYSGERRISIALGKTEDKIHLEYRDNGDQLTEDLKIDQSDGIGVHTIKSIIQDQLDGKWDYSIRKGLAWRIEFNDNRYSERLKSPENNRAKS